MKVDGAWTAPLQREPTYCSCKNATREPRQNRAASSYRESLTVHIPRGCKANEKNSVGLQLQQYQLTCFLDMLVWSPSGSCITMPRALPRGMMVALWTG